MKNNTITLGIIILCLLSLLIWNYKQDQNINTPDVNVHYAKKDTVLTSVKYKPVVENGDTSFVALPSRVDTIDYWEIYFIHEGEKTVLNQIQIK